MVITQHCDRQEAAAMNGKDLIAAWLKTTSSNIHEMTTAT